MPPRQTLVQAIDLPCVRLPNRPGRAALQTAWEVALASEAAKPVESCSGSELTFKLDLLALYWTTLLDSN